LEQLRLAQLKQRLIETSWASSFWTATTTTSALF
jgi:hypothetical protein